MLGKAGVFHVCYSYVMAGVERRGADRTGMDWTVKERHGRNGVETRGLDRKGLESRGLDGIGRKGPESQG